MSYRITMAWDQDASIWIATSNDVPGLVLESESFDELILKVRAAVPELLELNGVRHSAYSLNYSSIRSDLVHMYG